MSFLSSVKVAASIADFSVKKLLNMLVGNTTVVATGSTYANAAPLTSGKNMVTTSDGAKGVILPVAEPGMSVTVVNTVAASDLKVYPNTSAQINALTATSGAFTIPGGQEAVFHCDVLLHWYVSTGSGASAAELEVLNGASATNATTGKAAILGTGGALTIGGALTAVTSIGIGSAVLSEAEMEALDSAADTNLVAGKTAILGTGGALTLGGALTAVTSIGIGSAVLTEAEMEMLDTITAGTSAPSKALVLDAAESLVWATTDATQSETCTLTITDTRTGAGATGWAHKAELVSDVALGSYSNAIYGLVTFGANGSCTGLSAGVVGEMVLSAGTTGGTYASLEAELVANSAVSTGTDTGFIYANIAGSDGTGKTTINTNGHFAVLGTGVVDTTDGLFDVLGGTQAVTATARLRIKVGADDYFIPLCAVGALTS